MACCVLKEAQFIFLTLEYAKHNEHVIEVDGNFTRSLARSIT